MFIGVFWSFGQALLYFIIRIISFLLHFLLNLKYIIWLLHLWKAWWSTSQISLSCILISIYMPLHLSVLSNIYSPAAVISSCYESWLHKLVFIDTHIQYSQCSLLTTRVCWWSDLRRQSSRRQSACLLKIESSGRAVVLNSWLHHSVPGALVWLRGAGWHHRHPPSLLPLFLCCL